MKRWHCLEWVARALQQQDWGAASQPGSGCGREIQKMLRVYFGEEAALGLHPWASGLPAATVLSPVSPAAVFSIRRVIRYHKLWSLLWCWHTLFFQHSPPVLQDEGLLPPFFQMCFIMLNIMNIELKIPCMEPDSNIYCIWEMCNRA